MITALAPKPSQPCAQWSSQQPRRRLLHSKSIVTVITTVFTTVFATVSASTSATPQMLQWSLQLCLQQSLQRLLHPQRITMVLETMQLQPNGLRNTISHQQNHILNTFGTRFPCIFYDFVEEFRVQSLILGPPGPRIPYYSFKPLSCAFWAQGQGSVVDSEKFFGQHEVRMRAMARLHGKLPQDRAADSCFGTSPGPNIQQVTVIPPPKGRRTAV